MIIGLISSYKEHDLLHSAARSLLCGCDHIVIAEGPIHPEYEDSSDADIGMPLLGWSLATCIVGRWSSDAEKRTAMLRAAMHETSQLLALVGEPLWLVQLDADEVLLYGEYLPDWIARAEKDSAVGGFALRLVEFDGSVAKARCRIIRGDLVDHFVLGAYVLQTKDGMVIALPNEKICSAGGVPYKASGEQVTLEDLAELRPPLIGEPHILHRSFLRSPARKIEREHQVELREFEKLGHGERDHYV